MFHLGEDVSAVNLESKGQYLLHTVADARADGKGRLTIDRSGMNSGVSRRNDASTKTRLSA